MLACDGTVLKSTSGSFGHINQTEKVVCQWEIVGPTGSRIKVSPLFECITSMSNFIFFKFSNLAHLLVQKIKDQQTHGIVIELGELITKKNVCSKQN